MKRTFIFSIAAALAVSGGLLSGADGSDDSVRFESEPADDARQHPPGRSRPASRRTRRATSTSTRAPAIRRSRIGTARAVAHGGVRLFQFDRTGKFVREIGQGIYGFLQAQQVRVDPQDNVWVVDQMSTQVIKFDPNGRVQMILSRKPEAMTRAELPRITPLPTGIPVIQPEPPAAAAAAAGGGGGGAAAARGLAGRLRFPAPGPKARASTGRPTSPGTRRAISTSTDGYGNARVAKYAPNGQVAQELGLARNRPGAVQHRPRHRHRRTGQRVRRRTKATSACRCSTPKAHFKTQFTNVGAPTAMCLTRGAQPVLYVAHTGDPDGMEDAAIYKVDLKGNVLGKFGSAGKLPKEFGLVNSIDCRNENELLVGELANWRVQKITLRAAK